MMTKIALVLGGGASLGSYIGGALTEILIALQRNRAPGSVTVEVLTGSSAGALNAAIGARTLAVNRNLLPWIERAWVEAVDVDVLLDAARADRAGWLDLSAVEELSRVLVAADPASDDEPASAFGGSLRVGFTLTSLSGMRYDFGYGFVNLPQRRFGTRVFADSIDFRVTRAHRAGDPLWNEVREAAIASASFPFAFPPRRLRRRPSEYPGASLPPGTGREFDMWYVDGGLFDNAPLGLAKRLVERNGDRHEAEWRYIMVEPTLQSASFEQPTRGRDPLPPASLVDLGSILAGAVLGQGAAKDWIRANRINKRMEVLESLVERLPELNERIDDPQAVALGRHVGELAERVAERTARSHATDGSNGGDDPVGEYLDRNLERIESDPRFAATLARAESRAGRSRLAKLVFVLETACGLHQKTILPLYLIAPRRIGELSGDFMGNFGGFFHREWRANDFRAGRRDARSLLQDSLSDVITYDPDDAAAYRVDEIEPSFDAIPPAARRKLESLIEAEAEAALAELRPGTVASLLGRVWKPVVRRWITERAMSALRRMR